MMQHFVFDTASYAMIAALGHKFHISNSLSLLYMPLSKGLTCCSDSPLLRFGQMYNEWLIHECDFHIFAHSRIGIIMVVIIIFITIVHIMLPLWI